MELLMLYDAIELVNMSLDLDNEIRDSAFIFNGTSEYSHQCLPLEPQGPGMLCPIVWDGLQDGWRETLRLASGAHRRSGRCTEQHLHLHH
jgi:hypothetical protein